MSSLTTVGSSMEDEAFDTRLSLEIGGETMVASRPPQTREKTTTVRLFGELIFSPQVDHGGRDHRAEPRAAPVPDRKKRAHQNGGVDIASSGARHGKKARKATVQQPAAQDDGDRRSPSDGGSSRKKLRLTSAQATMLEDSFRAHNILSHAQKLELARRVGLSARQVEVWFQNRRARTKLKQTEVDCELLRRWCDRLTDENARLRSDLAELRAAAAAGRLPAVSVVCTSCCDRKMATVAGDVA